MFPADHITATIFEGQTTLKLGTHCQNEQGVRPICVDGIRVLQISEDIKRTLVHV
jgi:hypothetical protein